MLSRFSSQSKQYPTTVGGFGLIELMVSISIMILVAAVVLVRQNSFNGAVLLRSQAYEVALSAREVQLNAVSAASINGNYRTLLGLHFDTSQDGTYRIFKDADNDGFHDAIEEFGKQGFLDSRFEVREIRLINGNGFNVVLPAVSVVFERPNFDAAFFGPGNLGGKAIEIDISKRGETGFGTDVVRTVEITSTGQISVQ